MRSNDKSYTRFNVWPIAGWSDDMPGTLEMRAWDGYKYRPLGKAVRLAKGGDFAQASVTLNGGVPCFRLMKVPELCWADAFGQKTTAFVGIHIPKEGCN